MTTDLPNTGLFESRPRAHWLVFGSDYSDLSAEMCRDSRETGRFLGEGAPFFVTVPEEHGAMRQACHGVADAARRLAAHNAPVLPAMICFATSRESVIGPDYYHPLVILVANDAEAEKKALEHADHVVMLPGDTKTLAKAASIYEEFVVNTACFDKKLWLVGPQYRPLLETAATACAEGPNYRRAYEQLTAVANIREFEDRAAKLLYR